MFVQIDLLDLILSVSMISMIAYVLHWFLASGKTFKSLCNRLLIGCITQFFLFMYAILNLYVNKNFDGCFGLLIFCFASIVVCSVEIGKSLKTK